MPRLAGFSLAVLTGVSVAGATGQPAFRSGVELVTVPVTVVSEDGAGTSPVLSLADLRVLEDGQPQPVSFVELDTRPLSLAIVIDQSSSMLGLPRDWAVDAMRGVHVALPSTDEVALVAFGEWPIVPVTWTRVGGLDGFDWAQWVVMPATALVDAVGAAIELMDQRSEGRGVILVLSDGLELASTLPLSSVVQSRRQSETEVYAFEFDPPWDVDGRQQLPRWASRPDIETRSARYLEQLVGDSGGRVYTIGNTDAVAASIDELVTTLKGQFLVGYTSTKPPDGRYRRIKVEPTRRGLRLRHRGGYLAVPLAR